MADYDDLVVNHGDPHPQTVLSPPRRAIVRTTAYGGAEVDLALDVVASSPGYVCVEQARPGRTPWHAWIPSARARPL